MDPIELIGEFFGTLIYSYAVTTSNNNPFAVAGCIYIAMAFTGYVSTPQFNPAVTLSMALRRIYHHEFTIEMAIQFTLNVAVQIVSAVVAALLGWGTDNEPYAYTVQSGYNHSEAFLAEMIYSAVICATCLTSRRVTESLFISGAAISIAYFTGISSVARISAGSFNPAVALSLNFIHYLKSGTNFRET